MYYESAKRPLRKQVRLHRRRNTSRKQKKKLDSSTTRLLKNRPTTKSTVERFCEKDSCILQSRNQALPELERQLQQNTANSLFPVARPVAASHENIREFLELV